MNLAPLIQLNRGGTPECLHFGAVAVLNMPRGIDGCSAPNFAMPLSNLARGLLVGERLPVFKLEAQ